MFQITDHGQTITIQHERDGVPSFSTVPGSLEAIDALIESLQRLKAERATSGTYPAAFARGQRETTRVFANRLHDEWVAFGYPRFVSEEVAQSLYRVQTLGKEQVFSENNTEVSLAVVALVAAANS